MAIFRVEKSKDYTVMSNHHLRNSELSLKAKGLLSQILSLPEGWDYTLAGLAAINREGLAAVRSAVQELEAAGYILRRQTRDATGKLSGNEYVIYEQPVATDQSPAEPEPEELPAEVSPEDVPLCDFPTTDNPSTENPLSENQTQLNKDISSKDISKKKNKKEKAQRHTALTDEQVKQLCIDWAGANGSDRDEKNGLYFALMGFYAPREKAKQEPARTPTAFNTLTGRLIRFSGGSVPVMIDMLERAITAGWKSVFPLEGDRGAGQPPTREERKFVCL